MKTVKWFVRVALAMTVFASAAACTKTQARTPDQVLALNTPPPPSRITIPVQLPEPEREPAPAPPTATAATQPAARPRTETATARPTTPPAAPPTEPPPSGPVLQSTVDVGAVEQRTNTLLKEAQSNLDRIRPTEIGVQARAHYDSAKSFIRLAQQALRAKNYTYAEYLAVKAAALAKELAKG